MTIKLKPEQAFVAKLTAPDGYVGIWEVTATSKTEARKKLARLYRFEVGPPSAGFYAFRQNRLEWVDPQRGE